MAESFDRTKSLEELDNEHWGPPTYSSYLVKTCHALHRKCLNQFRVEDLRIMIGQRICLEYLIPLALEQLENDPWVEGDLYRGDLLKVTVTAGERFWADHRECRDRIRTIIHRAQQLLPALDDIDRSQAVELLAAVPQCLAP